MTLDPAPDTDPTARPTFDDEAYSAYLNAHLLAAETGLRAFNSAVGTWRGTEHEGTMRELVRHMLADRRDLKDLIEGLGYREAPLKRWLTAPAQIAGTFNPVNLFHLRRRTSTQLELDTLTGMVRAKLSMWKALIALHPRDPRLVLEGLRELKARAETQIGLIQTITDATVQQQFLRT